MTANATHYESKIVFDYSWKEVVQAYWNRYPNPLSSHVLTEDTISREVRDGKLYSRRLLSKTNPVPKWGERFYKNTPVKIVEDSILDPKKRILITFTRNIGFKKIMKVDEIVEYSEQRDGKTLAVRTAYISSQVYGFSRAIRAFGVERFKSNCNKATTGFNYVLKNMFPHQLATEAHALHLQKTSAPIADHSGAIIHQQQQQSTGKMEAIKKAGRSSYEYLKNQASKAAQMFSMKN